MKNPLGLVRGKVLYHDVAWHALRHIKGIRSEDIDHLAERIEEMCTETAAEHLRELSKDD